MARAKTEEAAVGTGARFLKLMQSVAEADRAFTLKDMAGRLQLPPSTTHRLLQLLVKADFLERSEGQSYSIGRELFRISAQVMDKFDLQKTARPYLEALWSEWQETCALCLYVPAQRTAVVVDTIRTPHPLQYVLEPFSRPSLTWGSLGRAVLAHLPEAEIERVLKEMPPGPLSGLPPPTRGPMDDELQRIRRRGYALYEDRSALDIAGVASPVFGRTGAVLGSIGVLMPGPRYDPIDKEALNAAVVLKARLLSAALGHDAGVLARR